MSDALSNNPLVRVARLFQSHGVEFMVIGGQAEVIFGSPRLTYDVDLCYRRTKENIARLAEAVKPLHVGLRGAPADLPFTPDARTLTMGCNFTFNTDHGKLDLLGWVEPLGDYDALVKNAETWEFAGMVLKTINLEDLIRIKEHIQREKDKESLVQLRAIKQVRREAEGDSC